MTHRIVIDPVTRIEGHAKITIYLDDADRVTEARFHVTEFRGFERFCVGRPFTEMAGLSARIKTLENAAGAALAKKAEGTERSTAASAGQGETPPDDPGPSEPAGASLDDGPAIGTPEYAELAKRALNDACMRFQKCYETQNVADPKKYVLEMRTKVLGELKFVGDEHLDQKKMMLAEAMQNRADKLKIP